MSAPGIIEEPDARIPVREGVRLAARIWRPEGSDTRPCPAILEYLPYRKRDGTAARDATTAPFFAAQGFAVLRVDIAGSGESDGLFDDEYSEQEMRDGEAVIAWARAQPWCDGNIGMVGISWGGFNGLQLAARRPEGLKAVVTMCSSVDRYADDIHYMGGCLLTDNFNWGAQMTAYMTRPPDPALRADWRDRWLERIEALPFLAADWLRHPARDAYWKHGSVGEDLGAIEAAVLAIGGWNDAYVNAPVALAEGMRAPVAALIGPWEHKYPHLSRIMAADFHGEALRWFGHYLAGEDTGAAALPRLRAYLLDHQPPSPLYGPRAGRWVAAADWPDGTAERVLGLAPGRLTEGPGAGEARISTSLRVGETSGYFCPGMRIDNELCADQAPDDALSVCFDTGALEAPLEILGRPVVEVAFRADRPAAQLVFRLCDVAPDGVSQRITYRPVNLTHHAGHDAPEALQPGRVYRMRIPLNACGHALRPGHRLRLAVSTSLWPVVWPVPETAEVTLDLSACRLVLPERRATGAPAMAPGPARDFPTLAAEMLSGPESRSTRHVDPDGRIILETRDDFGTVRNLEHGLETGHSVRQSFSIREGDPVSARHEAVWHYAFARPGWQVTLDTSAVMTCDSERFHLHRRVIAREGGVPVLDRAWDKSVPRGHL